MTVEDEDRDLREDFARLRREREVRTPAYRTVLARDEAASAGGGWGWPAFALPTMALVALAAWILLPAAAPPVSRPLAQPGEWQVGPWHVPSDALLDLSSLPGSSVMGDLEVGPVDFLPERDDAARGAPPDRAEERSFG